MSAEDGVKKELNLDNIINESTYDAIMNPIKEAKKRASKIKKAAVEAGKDYAGVSPVAAPDEDDSAAMPKGKEQQIQAGTLAMGLPPAPRENRFKNMELKLNEITGRMELAKKERKKNEVRHIENETEISRLRKKKVAQAQTRLEKKKVAQAQIPADWTKRLYW